MKEEFMPKYKKLFSLIDEKKENIISDRRWLHQHPEFDINEGAMIIAAKAMGAVVLKYLG